ncbi:hypothetical protein [Sulfitobacter sp. R18_1]|uniref:DUF7831 domain-containing protein n=1 Tax=Sulfitobacter sp. R18_1 TaxID=2821104 RepID=UPI001ADD4D5D|nr:hypothetical protein [Sulfitobacter sp. R18_1]MBO9428352.1 hypothetical protein [Sulfitobacter sp. R18_1]
MPVIKQSWITREDLKSNPDRLYIFGDNVIRRGYGGQAKAMRGEPNAIGIATKRLPSLKSDAFFYDTTYEENCEIIEHDFEPVFSALKAGKTVVFPTNGIGTDRARIHETAPRTAAFLDTLIKKMMSFDKPADKPRPRLSIRPRVARESSSSFKP